MASMSDRDRKILLAVIPVVVIVAYWFLLLGPTRKDAATASAQATKQEKRRDAAKAEVAQASAAKTDFRSDYTQIVRLGKAIPAQVDMPSLLVQLEGAAKGTGIRFTKISQGERIPVEIGPGTHGGHARARRGREHHPGGSRRRAGPERARSGCRGRQRRRGPVRRRCDHLDHRSRGRAPGRRRCNYHGRRW